jgi:hypothetical protein
MEERKKALDTIQRLPRYLSNLNLETTSQIELANALG